MGNSHKHEPLKQEDAGVETTEEKRRREEQEAREALAAEKKRQIEAECEVKNAAELARFEQARMACRTAAELWYKERAYPALQTIKQVDELTEDTIGDYIKQLPRYNAGCVIKCVKPDFDEVMADEVTLREVLKLRIYKRLFAVEKLLLQNYVVDGTSETERPQCSCPRGFKRYMYVPCSGGPQGYGPQGCGHLGYGHLGYEDQIDRRAACDMNRWTLHLPRELWQGFTIALRVADIKQDTSVAETRENALRDIDWDKIHAQLLKALTKCMNAEIAFTLHAIVKPHNHPEYAFPLISTGDINEAKQYIDFICYHSDTHLWPSNTAAEPCAPAENDDDADALSASAVEGMAHDPVKDVHGV